MSAAWQLKLLFLEEKLQLGFHIDLNCSGFSNSLNYLLYVWRVGKSMIGNIESFDLIRIQALSILSDLATNLNFFIERIETRAPLL